MTAHTQLSLPPHLRRVLNTTALAWTPPMVAAHHCHSHTACGFLLTVFIPNRRQA